MDMSLVHGGLPRFEEKIFDKSLLMKGVGEVNNKWKCIQEEDEVEASNNSESTSWKPSSNHKPTKKSHLTFNAPALKEFNLVYSASEEKLSLELQSITAARTWNLEERF
jgi:phosphatidate phosphatase PAH1